MQHTLDCPPILCHISHKYDSLGPGEYFHNPNIVVVICIYRKIDGVKGHGSAALNIITAMKLPFSSCSQANSAWVKQLFNKFPSSNHFVASIPLSCLWIQQHLRCKGSTIIPFSLGQGHLPHRSPSLPVPLLLSLLFFFPCFHHDKDSYYGTHLPLWELEHKALFLQPDTIIDAATIRPPQLLLLSEKSANLPFCGLVLTHSIVSSRSRVFIYGHGMRHTWRSKSKRWSQVSPSTFWSQESVCCFSIPYIRITSPQASKDCFF